MNVANDFSLHPDVPVVILSCTFPPDNATEHDTAAVLPISAVDVSVNSAVASLHTAITSPDLALDPLDTVYLKNADVYDPVACVNTVFEPAADEFILA